MNDGVYPYAILALKFLVMLEIKELYGQLRHPIAWGRHGLET